jgi:hypothetical protein
LYYSNYYLNPYPPGAAAVFSVEIPVNSPVGLTILALALFGAGVRMIVEVFVKAM